MRESEKGFTLVELSIVLVIIGLLIGGILAAQSMIETAKIQSVIREIQQLDAAVTNFQTKYNSLPGDSSTFGCVVSGSNVCDDGKITDNNCCGGADLFDTEIANFWVQLQKGGFDYGGKTFTATPPAGVTDGRLDTTSNTPNLPSIKGSIDGGVIGSYCNTLAADGVTVQSTNCWSIADFKGPGANAGNNFFQRPPSFTVEAALAIDTKVDDGKPLYRHRSKLDRLCKWA